MKYLLSPADYPLPNPRIDGWKKLPQDIKWAIDEKDQIWVLQSRDLSLETKV